MDGLMIKIDNVSKMYKLGQIGGTTLRDELQRKFAQIRGKEDPTKRIGTKDHKKNETFMALDGVSFEVKKGECIGIIGHNGAGKSTLLKLLARVTAPTGGEIYLNGRVASMLEVGTGFHPELTGRENIYMNGAILGMTKAEIDRKIEEIIEFSECRQFIDTPVKRYSSGMYVKLAFSVAAHLDSEIMIMDEVLAVGDVKFQKKCLGKMGDEASNEGKTILYVSHNMSTIRQLCNRCIVLDHGKVIFEGDVEKAISIYENSTFEDLRKVYDFKEVARPPYGHGEQIFIDSFEFDDKEKPIYHNLEKIRFTINFHTMVNMDNLNLYFTIKAADGTVIGTTQSNWNKNVSANESYSDKFELDTSNLAEGFYHFQVDLFSYGVGGVYHSYDRPLKDVTFSIIDADYKGINWNSKNFGYIRLSPIVYNKDTNY